MISRSAGFTLIELVLVMALASLLLTLAMPAFEAQLRQGRRALAVSHLHALQVRQEQFRLQQQHYAGDFTLLGLAHPHGLDGAGRVVAAAAADSVYRIELAQAGPQQYRLLAVPQGGQLRDLACGRLQLDETGARSVSGSASAQDCW